MGSPFVDHPFRPVRLPRPPLRWLWSILLLVLYHHFHTHGLLSDEQWKLLRVDGIALGSQSNLPSPYLHLDPEGRVRYVSGRQLSLQGTVLLRVGDEITAGREILGDPKIISDSAGTYYFYHRGRLSVACALGEHERISQICLQKGQKKPVKH